MPVAPIFTDPSIRSNVTPAARANISAQVKSNLLSEAARALALGAGAGIGGRGLLGLYNLVRRNMSAPPRAESKSLVIDVPSQHRDKSAGWWENLKALPGETVSALKGQYATTTMGHPLWPLVPAGAAVGAGAGWKLSDILLDKQRNAARKAKLEEKKKEYTAALTKRSALGEDLDKLYDQCTEKKANLNNIPGGLLGLYLLTSALSAGGAGLAGYNYAKGKQPNPVLGQAIIKHRKAMGAQPTRITAVPTPPSMTPMDEEEKQDINALSI